MKIHDKLNEILTQGAKIKILRLLFSGNDEYTGREIARGIGMSASSVHKTLQAMKGEGLISVRRKGNAILYKLQEDNYIVKKMLGPLFEKEKSLYSEVVAVIKKNLRKQKKGILSMILFGSVARGGETSRSDIDLMIVTKNKTGKGEIDKAMDKLSFDMVKQFGVAISPYVLTKAEIKEKHVKKQPLINSILESNRLIYGEPIARILA